MSQSNKKNTPSIDTFTVPEAAKKANVTNETIRNWIRDFKKYKIGQKKGGRWMVYSDGLDRILKGELTYEDVEGKKAANGRKKHSTTGGRGSKKR